MDYPIGTSYSNIKLEICEGIGHITLNRPPMNVIDIPTMRELNDALDRVEADPTTRVIHLDAAGEKSFSVGVDVKDHTREKIKEMLDNFHGIFFRLLDTSRISVAKVQGYCLGGGCELALLFDFVVASDDAVFGQPEIDVGCFPPVAAAVLPFLVGYRKAVEITTLGKRFAAQEALDWGLVNRVAPRDKLSDALKEIIDQIMMKSGPVISMAKRSVVSGLNSKIKERIRENEKLYVEELMSTEDVEEGVKAFAEKRKPVWAHR